MNPDQTPVGAVPATWEVRTLKDLASKIGSGSTPRGGAAVYVEDGIAFIRSQNVLDHRFNPAGLAFLEDEAAKSLAGVTVETGDVLLNITGDSILRCTVVPDAVLPARVSQHVAIIRVRKHLEPIILQKYLTHPRVKHSLLGLSSGGTRKAITKSHIESLPVPVPPLHEQRAIAEVLGALDDKIESNRHIAAVCEQLLSTFASFTSTKTLVPLSELAQVARVPVDPQALGELTVDHFSIPAFDAQRLPESCLASTIKSGKFAVEGRSVLVSRLNPSTSRVWLADPVAQQAMCSTEFLVLRPLDDQPMATVWLAAISERFSEGAARRATGTSFSHQRIKPDDALSIEVPDTRLVDKSLLAKADALLERALRARRESAVAESLRDALLPELLSGRIRVPEARELVGDAS